MADSSATRESTRGPRAVLSWSSGKDAAFALHELRRTGDYDVVALLTAVTARTGRVATHGIRGTLLRHQAASVGLPLTCVPLPRSPSNAEYEKAMAAALQRFHRRGIRHVVFGDLFLEDIRAYREAQLAKLGLEAVFPLWGRDTTELARQMSRSGVEARLVSVDTRVLAPSWAGRRFDDLVDHLPGGVDPCGENGEFHTFVTAGPMLRWGIAVRTLGVTVADGVATADLGLAREGPSRIPPRPPDASGIKHKTRGAPEAGGGSIG